MSDDCEVRVELFVSYTFLHCHHFHPFHTHPFPTVSILLFLFAGPPFSPAGGGGVLPPVAGFGPGGGAGGDPTSLVPTSQESLFAGLWKPGWDFSVCIL